MHKVILILLVIFSLISGKKTMAATIPIKFGMKGVVKKMEDVKLKSSDGEKLSLGFIQNYFGFVLPLWVYKGDYILIVDRVEQNYYLLPADQEIVQLQNAGLLPKEFPPKKLSFRDSFAGLSFWLLSLLISLGFVSILLNRKNEKKINTQGQMILYWIPPMKGLLITGSWTLIFLKIVIIDREMDILSILALSIGPIIYFYLIDRPIYYPIMTFLNINEIDLSHIDKCQNFVDQRGYM